VALVVALCWLLLRPAFRFAEWVLLIALVTATNVAGQLGAGSSHNGVLALNSLAVFALVCVAFESSLVVVAAALFMAGYAAIQLHFYGAGDAAAATVMYAVVLSVVALGVHGTALYLRESLRRTAELHAEMEHTAEQERARIAGSCTTTPSRC
jgi:signal transduction histidine kinase